ncbi:hypothetical protein K0M31_002742 [Melipona bicolor]|uniref:Uncharacterized protein n=1 Tax=Melipona bicolor TaxID=60889 RepID=A0AA40FZM0_9HYME|nr:hypothetical protein K0M31_002742 [Melipona bicolor]
MKEKTKDKFIETSTGIRETEKTEKNRVRPTVRVHRREHLGTPMITNGTQWNSSSRRPSCHVDDTDDTETGLTRTCWSIALCSNRLAVYNGQTETQSAI